MSIPTGWRRVLTLFLTVLLLAAGGQAARVGTIDFSSLTPAEAVPGELLVKFRSDVAAQVPVGLHTAAGAEMTHAFKSIPWQLVKVPDGASLQAAADAYLADPNVVYVEPNYKVYPIETIPDDPDFDQLWGMERINAPEAWDVTTGTSDVVVAVIDTGIRRTHEDLEANMWTNPGEIAGNGVDDDGNGYVDDVYGWDFFDNDNDPTDTEGHGTHCAGTIGAVGNNGIGVVGVNWNVSLVAVRFLGPGGGSTAGAIKSVEYVSSLSQYVRLSNNSWGGGGYSTALEEAIRESGENNQLFLAAAGNSSTDNDVSPHYPSSYDLSNIVAVASITSGGGLSSFSCYGATSVDIGAPGSDILSTVSSSDSAYDTYSGTSMATPHVCGAAALLWGQNLGATWEEIRAAILDTAEPNPALAGRVVTGGELDLAAALGQVGGALTLDQLAYRSDALVGITVADANVLEPTNTVEVIWQVTDPNAAARAVGELDLVRVTGTGFFTNSLQLVSGPTNMAVHGDLLRVSYESSTSNLVAVTAPIDDLPPVISNVRALPLDEDSQLIAWDTDESASELALVSLTVPPDTNTWKGSAGFANWGSDQEVFPHSVTFDDLREQSIYHYAVRSADPAGNEAIYPTNLLSVVSEEYPRFATSYARETFFEDFESGELEWTHGGLNDCWEYGIPAFGPDAAYSGSNCWATCLDDNYPDLMNAWLVSPAVSVGTSPRLTFMSWHLIEEGYDNGYVEVNWGSGWSTLLAISGSSLGEWVPVTVFLPEAANNKVIQVRFRLQSDYVLNYAGWYIDDVMIRETAGVGVGVVDWVNPVNDAVALDGDNDADGYPEIGETFDLNFSIFNSRDMTFVDVVSRVDCPADGVEIDSDHDELDFGDVPFGALVQGEQPLRVTVSSTPPQPLDNVPFLHTITASGGYEWQDIIYLDLTEHEAVSGTVTDLGASPIAGATVHGMSAAGDEVEAVTAADGTYLLNGLELGAGYDVYAAKAGDYGASPSVTVTGPAVNVDFVLGRAFADAAPTPLSATVEQTGVADVALTIANTNVLADQNLVVALTGTVASADLAISFPGAPAEVVVAPGGSAVVTVRVTASGAATGDYEGTVTMIGNAVQGTAVNVPIDIEVTAGPVLNLWYVLVDDSLTGDDDGFIDPGETIEPGLVVENFDGEADAIGVTGVLCFVGASGVTAVTDGDLDFLDIPAGFFWFDFGQFVVDPAAPDGLELPFTLELWDAAGHYWMFPFSLTVEKRVSIRGTITDAVTTSPVEGVSVTAVGAGESGFDVSAADGTYGIHGVASGVYTVSVAAVSGYANPPSQVCVVSNADCIVDFALPPLDIGWDPASFTRSVPEGRELVDSLTISNNGIADVEVRLRGAMKEGALVDPVYSIPDVAAVNWSALTEEEAHLDRMIVRFREQTDVSAMNDVVASVNGKVVKRLRNIPAALVALPPSQPLDMAASILGADAGVLYVQPDYRYKLDALPGTPRREPNDMLYGFGSMWGMDNAGQDDGTQDADIDGPEAWFQTTGDTNVIVAVLDSGIDWEHVDLVDNLWRNPGEDGIDTNGMHMSTNGVDDDSNGYIDDYYGWNFLYSTNGGFYEGYYTNGMPIDDHGHGTHCSGTIGAMANNDEGVVGVNWHVRIMACKIGDLYGYIDAFASAEALEYAVDNGAKVSNNSWGGLQFNYLFHEMVAYARTNNHLVLCAAGNDGVDNDAIPHYPSSDPSDNILSVAAADRNDMLADFSNWGENSVDIAAPGVAIWSTLPGDDYDAWNGTSMATPHVTGIAALLKSYAPDAPWDMLKTAIMDSARHDPRLVGMLQAEGHANAFNALRMMGALWMAFDPDAAVVPSAGTVAVNLTFNVDGVLAPGHYEADIVLESGAVDTSRIPVELDVTYAPIPQYVSVRVDDTAGDGDGYAEPGEQVDLYVTLRNRGSLTLAATTATLATTQALVTVDSGALGWTALESGDSVASAPAATVTFGSGVSSSVTFTFDVDDGVNLPWTGLTFELPVVPSYAISGTVREQGTLTPVPGATVEFFGAMPGEVPSGPDGAYVAEGLPAGTYTVRARKSAYGRGEWQTVVVTGDMAQDLELGLADGSAAPGTLTFAMLAGQSDVLPVAMTNAGVSDWSGTVYEIARRRVAVISDGARLTALETLLTQLGMDVTGYADNATQFYTAQEGMMSEYDLVIADMGGAGGLGRKVVIAEQDAIGGFVTSGGMFIVTGRNILGTPDNGYLGDLVGSSTLGKQLAMVDEAEVGSTADAALSGPYITLTAGQRLAVTSNYYDMATADTNLQAAALLHVGMGDKVIRRPLGSGVIVYWSGHHAGAEWTAPGPLQELFRNIVLDLTMADVSWLAPQSGAFTLAASGDTNLNVEVTAPNALSEEGATTAALLLVGNLPDQPDRVVLVSLDTGAIALRAKSTAGVRRWDNSWLEGDGGNGSCLFQLIDAGTDGTNNPAGLDGGTTGDDMVLAALDTGELFGRFGDGYELQPDQGLFNRRFGHSLMAGQKVYVRAWDAPTFASAVAYGDSHLYEIQRIADEMHDFGAWIVDTSIDFPGNTLAELRDQDGDSIPDGYALQIGLDPRDPIGPLTPSVTVEAEATGFSRPGRVSTWSNFVFVADSEQNRIVVLSTDLATELSITGSYGTGNGRFDSPQGLAVYGAAAKLVVADTHNHRVQLFDINPTNGSLTYASQFGSEGAADGQFRTPYAVEVSQFSGRIYVADSYPHGEGFNHRIQRFSSAGVHELSFGVQGPAGGQFNRPLGIALDAGGLLYTADQDNNRVQCTTTTGIPLWQRGTYGTALGEMAGPRGLSMGMLSRLYVADTSNHRIQVLRTDGAPGTITAVGSFGMHGDEDGEFSFPQGVCAMSDSPMVYVADTYNDRVQLLSFIMDNDGDGMDDMWEDGNGLDSTDPDDWGDDPDGDGIINIGEYRIGTDPHNGDSNGNGGSDGLEIALGRDPLAEPGLDLLVIRSLDVDAPWGVAFNVISGGTYQVQTRTNLLSGTWSDLGAPTAVTADGVITVEVPTPPEPERFYRIEKTN